MVFGKGVSSIAIIGGVFLKSRQGWGGTEDVMEG